MPAAHPAISRARSLWSDLMGPVRRSSAITHTPVWLHRGDITAFAADVIVNAANSSLLGGGGVDGAIHRVGGPQILRETRRLRSASLRDGLPAGQATATNAGDLPARWVVHTVGPVYSTDDDRSEVLRSCHRESVALAEKLGARTIAFPAVSTGAYGWPVEDAAGIAVAAVREAIRGTHIERVTFVLQGDEAFEAFTAALAR